MDPILAALTFGALGQAGRVLVGFKKLMDAGNRAPDFDWTRLLVSLGLGATAGLAATAFGHDPAFLCAAGYMGADALEGFARKAGA